MEMVEQMATKLILMLDSKWNKKILSSFGKKIIKTVSTLLIVNLKFYVNE